MYAKLDGLEFVEYLWRRRGTVLAACACALAISGAVSLLLPCRYTATATVLIELPGGNDPRAATAVSPVYLESLKTYELLASSDTLFSTALEDLHLRRKYGRASVESLKRRILSLNKPSNTSILEISATLDDPSQAQALAQYIAEHTVALQAQMDEQSNQEVSREPHRLFDAATVRLTGAQQARDRFTDAASVEMLSKDATSAADTKTEVERQMASARAELAEDVVRAKSSQDGPGAADVAAVRARVEDLETQARQLSELLGQKTAALERMEHTRDSLDAEVDSARSAQEGAQTKLADVEASAALRGVRLKVLDPGIVPEQASFPNTPLNLVVAFVLSAGGSIVFLALRFGWGRLRLAHADPVYSLRSE